MNDAAQLGLFQQVHDIWIQPEVDRRRAAESLPVDFKIYQAQILLPRDRTPIVRFNDEQEWMALVKLGDLAGMKIGDPVHFDQVHRYEVVSPPQIDGKRVAFIFLFKVTNGYQILFDCSPNVDDAVIPEEEWKETIGRTIAQTLQDGLVERSVSTDQIVNAQLRAVGLWPAPALVPYPFGEIVRLVTTGDTAAARSLLVKTCHADFLRQMVAGWWNSPEFKHRELLLSTAIEAHCAGRYVLSIPTLLPQLEGVITDWMVRTAPSEVTFRQESKTKKFRDLVLAIPERSFAFREVVKATISFLLDGPVLASFKNWSDAVDCAFPNRHVVEHGRHEHDIYTEENSIKLILLLDTLHAAMTQRALRSDEAPVHDASTEGAA